MRSRLILIFVFSILGAGPGDLRAETEFRNAMVQGIGGSGRSSVLPGEFALNPATIVYTEGYHFLFGYRNWTSESAGDSSSFKFSLLDNHPNQFFPAALTFSRNKNDESYRVGLAKRIGTLFAVGVEIQRYIYKPTGGNQSIEHDLTLGLNGTITPVWGVGLVASNLLNTENAALNRTLGFGTNYSIDSFVRVQLDVLFPLETNPLQKVNVYTGFESFLVQEFAVRGGYRAENYEGKYYWSAGFGWIGPKIGVDYAFEKDIKNTHGMAHSVDVRIYF